jgi:glycosyltransferase involved in cell wall biosynthesis
MKKCIKILNMRYLDYDGRDITIGGVQTYITNLARVAQDLGMSVEVFQFANNDFNVKYNDIVVHGFSINQKLELAKKKKALFDFCMCSFDSDSDLLIFGTDLLVVKTKKPFAIAIQHGIGWDIESSEPCSRIQNLIHSLRQARRGMIITGLASNVKKMICVDYNYINWYRTQVLHHEMDYQVIPNFTEIPKPNTSKFNEDGTIKIIFARRLVPYRGTRIFAEAAEKILKKYENIEITFAGDGPEEEFLKDKFKTEKRVKFITYHSRESLDIHRDKHIAVIPTIGSEGTSLSLLEAMASSCAVICTNVGGMTNIVIDNHNGLMINPEANCLYHALVKLVSDQCISKKLAGEAYNTVNNGFSFEVWKEKWVKVLKDFE